MESRLSVRSRSSSNLRVSSGYMPRWADSVGMEYLEGQKCVTRPSSVHAQVPWCFWFFPSARFGRRVQLKGKHNCHRELGNPAKRWMKCLIIQIHQQGKPVCWLAVLKLPRFIKPETQEIMDLGVSHNLKVWAIVLPNGMLKHLALSIGKLQPMDQLFVRLQVVEPSAHEAGVLGMLQSLSFMHTRNRMGPRTDSCGTPIRIMEGLENEGPVLTLK